MSSSWWDDCLDNNQAQAVKACAKSDQARVLLRENIALNRDLGIMFGPTYLLDNQEIFSTQEIPAKDELKKILQRK